MKKALRDGADGYRSCLITHAAPANCLCEAPFQRLPQALRESGQGRRRPPEHLERKANGAASAITLYLINGIMGFQPLAIKLVGGDLGSFVNSHLTPGAGSLLAHSVGLLLAVALASFLYRRKIFPCV